MSERLFSGLNKGMAYHQGEYKVINTDKYLGTTGTARYLSSWELHLLRYFDLNPNVIKWGGDNIVIIPYISPIDNKQHRYMVDFYIEYLDKDSTKRIEILECKPFKETQPPSKRGKSKQRQVQEALVFVRNQAKWKFATEYAKARGWTFRVITEKNIFG